MAKYYAPNFSGLLPLFDGKSAAGGKLYAYRAGSSIPAPLFDEDGVELGSWVSIDSNGCASFLLDSALSYKLVAKDALGAVVGEWDNVKATNAPGMDNPMTAPGDIIVGGTGGTGEALSAGNDDQMLTPYTQDGVKKLKWKNVPAQPGDHKTAVDGADASPDYLANKLAAGSGISLTNTGSAVEIAATAQSGDHQLLVSATDASAGYLGAKLTAGSNVTLTPQTDGDGVQTLEISATGGGGGGGLASLFYVIPPYLALGNTTANTSLTFMIRVFAERTGTPSGLTIIQYDSYANTAINAAVYAWDDNRTRLCYGEETFPVVPAGHVYKIPFTTKTAISVFDPIVLCFRYTSAPSSTRWRKYTLPATSTVRYSTTPLTSSTPLPWDATSTTTLDLPLCGLYYDS